MPVNLEPCRFCEAINKRSDVACHKCGILLARPAETTTERAPEVAPEMAMEMASSARVAGRGAVPPAVATPRGNAPPPTREAHPDPKPGAAAPTNEQRPPVCDPRLRPTDPVPSIARPAAAPTDASPSVAGARAPATAPATPSRPGSGAIGPSTVDGPQRPADSPPRVDATALQANAQNGAERREPSVGLDGVHRAAALASAEDPDDEAAAAHHRKRFGRTAFLFVILALVGAAGYLAARDPARFQDGIDAVERKVDGAMRKLLPPRPSPANETAPSPSQPERVMFSPPSTTPLSVPEADSPTSLAPGQPSPGASPALPAPAAVAPPPTTPSTGPTAVIAPVPPAGVAAPAPPGANALDDPPAPAPTAGKAESVVHEPRRNDAFVERQILSPIRFACRCGREAGQVLAP